MDKTLIVNIFDYHLIKLEDIYKYKNLNYSMYAILSFDRMYFDKPKAYEDHIEVDYGTEVKRGIGYISLEPNDDSNKQDILLSSKYPQDVLHINDEEPGIIASDLYAFANENPSFEIEYIGISKANTACIRLSNHTTLQKILIDNQSKHLNKDLYILLFNEKHMEIKEVKVEQDNDEISEEEAAEEFMKQFDEVYEDIDVVTALTEAILINQLKPKYNIEYMNSKQNTMFSTLKTLYHYSFDKGVINLCLKESDFRKNITLSTSSGVLKFNDENHYRQSVECPFCLTEK